MTGFNQSDHDRFDKIEKEIEAARAAGDKRPETMIPLSDAKAMNAGRAGFVMMGIVLAGVALGWLADEQFDNAPWGIFGGLFGGFALAIIHAWKVMQERE